MGVNNDTGIAQIDDTVQGIQGIQGNQGLQGLRGAQGVQGVQGPIGYNGRIGAQGKIGGYGMQGANGSQGLQGVQGKKGVQGVQGTRGCNGAQGVAGSSGVQGVQGNRGVQGAQGTRGCNGAQGAIGVTGTQGAQGKRGAQGSVGFMGLQGVNGAQGPQGIKGRIGAQGILGYQGDDGEVGIQGVMGETGSVWVDGIRLNGYNTHLFEFDSDERKFVSRNVNTDLLYIRNGAKISVWLDKNAYESIRNSGSIVIDRLEDGEFIETSYPVYYAGKKALSEVITPANDIDSVVELTYREGAWYYSGGLLTPTITKDITVTGVELGQLHEGALIEAGTTIQELFNRLLVKEIDVYSINPEVSLEVIEGDIIDNSIYEVGCSINGNLDVEYTDGKFVGKAGYDYMIDAECQPNMVSYYMNGKKVSGNNIVIDSIGEEEIVLNSIVTYSDSEAKPRTNVGNLSDVKIEGGSVTTNNITINGCYRIFYGNQTASTASTINDPKTYQFMTQESLTELNKSWMVSNGDTMIESIESTDKNPSFVIVIPSMWNIIETQNSLGQSVNVETTWYKQNTIKYNNNGVETEYQVYVSPSTESSVYKNIILSK